MKKTDISSLKDIINITLNQNKDLKESLYKQKAIDLWEEVVGIYINSSTKDIKIVGKTMFVSIANSIMRNEIFLNRHIIINKINNKIGEKIITELIVR